MENHVEEFLNGLGDAERAGGRVLHELTGQAKSLELKELLKKVAHDEGYYAGELSHHVRRLGGNASNKPATSWRRSEQSVSFAASSSC